MFTPRLSNSAANGLVAPVYDYGGSDKPLAETGWIQRLYGNPVSLEHVQPFQKGVLIRKDNNLSHVR